MKLMEMIMQLLEEGEKVEAVMFSHDDALGYYDDCKYYREWLREHSGRPMPFEDARGILGECSDNDAALSYLHIVAWTAERVLVSYIDSDGFLGFVAAHRSPTSVGVGSDDEEEDL